MFNRSFYVTDVQTDGRTDELQKAGGDFHTAIS